MRKQLFFLFLVTILSLSVASAWSFGDLFKSGGVTGKVTVAEGTYHSADINRDNKIDLIEHTRVVELYNYRMETAEGNVRTGEYHIQAGTEDGYVVGPGTQTAGQEHSADYNKNWKIDVDELSRITSLYNAKTGGTRTGEYRAYGDTLDGYLPVTRKPLACGILGDIDADNNITTIDYQMIGEVSAGIKTADLQRADLNADGSVTTSDWVLHGRYINGLNNTFPGCSTSVTNQSCVSTTMNGYNLPAMQNVESDRIVKQSNIPNGVKFTYAIFSCINKTFTMGVENIDISCSPGYLSTGTQCVLSNSSSTCTDSDGGLNYNVKGTVSAQNQLPINPREDYCLTPQDSLYTQGDLTNPEKYLIELYCNGTDGAGVSYKCPNGCSNGTCIQNTTQAPLCSDSDGGLNYNIKGFVNSSGQITYDTCIANDQPSSNGTELAEYSCSASGNKVQSPYVCPNGCVNGECIKKEGCKASEVIIIEGKPKVIPLGGSDYIVSIFQISDGEAGLSVILGDERKDTGILHEGDNAGVDIAGTTLSLYIHDIDFEDSPPTVVVSISDSKCSNAPQYLLPYDIGVFHYRADTFESGKDADMVDYIAAEFSKSEFVDGESAKLEITYNSEFDKDAAIALVTFEKEITLKQIKTSEAIIKTENKIKDGGDAEISYIDSGELIERDKTGKLVVGIRDEKGVVFEWVSNGYFVMIWVEDNRAIGSDANFKKLAEAYLDKYPSTLTMDDKPSVECTDGCSYDGRCIPIGTRTNDGKFCSYNAVLGDWVEAGGMCTNNFECGSNVCVSNQCVDAGLIDKILNWFKRLFDGEQPKLFPSSISGYDRVGGIDTGSGCENFEDQPDARQYNITGRYCMSSQRVQYEINKADNSKGVFVIFVDFTEGLEFYQRYLEQAATREGLRVSGTTYEVLRLEDHELLWSTAKPEIDLIMTQEYTSADNGEGQTSYNYDRPATGDNDVTRYFIRKYPSTV